MSGRVLVIGVDPGLTTGLMCLTFDAEGALVGSKIAMQIHGSEGVVPTVQTLLAKHTADTPPLVAVEQFVVGNRASRSSSAHAGRITRALVAELAALADSTDATLFTRNASLVKTWATDKRLAAAGLLDSTKGMGHARDAARHALYAAVNTGLTHDPLSKQATG